MNQPKMITLLALCVIRLPGKKVLPGNEFPCEPATAEQFINNGSARVAGSDTIPTSDDDVDGKAPAKRDELGGVNETEQRSQAIGELLAAWKAADPDQKDKTKWKADGAPRNKAVDNALGFNVTNDEILPIWEALTPAKDGDA